MKRRRLRSAGIRLATVYAALFGMSALALVLFIWWATAGLLERQVEATIHADAQGLLDRISEGGLPALVESIQDRMSEDVDDETLYLLVDGEGHHLAGNLEHWPAAVSAAGAWYELPVQRAGTRALAEVERIELPGHFRLLVGRDVRTRAQLRQLLAGALLWALGLVAGLSVIGALVVRRLFRGMLANVSLTSEAIAAGDLAQRVRLSGRGDEFDRLAETINDMLDRIARLMDGVRQVSNAIAHDLRTPITRARTRLEDAALHADSDGELRAAVERAVADLDGVTAVFQALLRIAEIEAGSRRAAFARFDCVPVLRDLAELYGALAEERGLELALALPPALWVQGDRDLLQQAVANLLDNAVKFSPAGGTVLLGAGFGPDAEAGGQGAPAPAGASQAAERLLRITVTDRGPGIPAGDLAKAPERFFRGEAARHTPGSGLGLALVQAVAQLHGGALRLGDAAPGLRATLALPAPDRADALPGPSARPAQDHAARARAGTAAAGGRGFIPAPPAPHP
ncbi:MAG: ATP-binding protein [Janthinobacterium lividum]